MSNAGRFMPSALIAAAIGMAADHGLHIRQVESATPIIKRRRRSSAGTTKTRIKGKHKPAGAKLARAANRHRIGINKRGY